MKYGDREYWTAICETLGVRRVACMACGRPALGMICGKCHKTCADRIAERKLSGEPPPVKPWRRK